MYTARLLVALTVAISAVAVSGTCTTNDRGCGGGHPVSTDSEGNDAPDGSMYICDYSGQWQLSAICGGTTYCVLSDDGPYCSP